MTTKDKCNEYQEWIKKLSFPVFILSMVFMIFYSNQAINYWESPWSQLSIIIACLLPLIFVIINETPTWLQGKSLDTEIFFVPLIIFLGILNVAFGEVFLPNLKGMGLFLLSGICIFVSAKFILKSHRAQTVFLWVCTFVLVVISLHSIYVRWWLDYSWIEFFSNNPILESVVVTLLITGPLILFQGQKTRFGQWGLAFCLLLGIITIIFINQRAAMISLLIIFFLLGFIFVKRFWIYCVCVTIFATIAFNVGYQFHNKLPKKMVFSQSLEALRSQPINRMEMYFFAYNLFKKYPFLGSGLWTPLTHHLFNYEEKLFITPKNDKTKFQEFVGSTKNTSFHNILLCMFVQMGSLFTITYLAFIFYLLIKLYGFYKKSPENLLRIKLVLIIFTGFFLQSLSVDTLMYPDVNFLYHSLLGLISNFDSNINKTV